MSIAFASSRAPDQDGDVLTDPGRACLRLYSHSGLAPARSNKLVVVLPTDTVIGLPPQGLRRRSVRDSQIPIGRLPHTAPFLPAVSSLGGFRTPALSPAPRSRNGPAPETLHQLRRPRLWSATSASRRLRPSAVRRLRTSPAPEPKRRILSIEPIASRNAPKEGA